MLYTVCPVCDFPGVAFYNINYGIARRIYVSLHVFPEEQYIANLQFQAARILAKLVAWGKPRMALREQKYYMGWLIVALNNEVGEMSAFIRTLKSRGKCTD